MAGSFIGSKGAYILSCNILWIYFLRLYYRQESRIKLYNAACLYSREILVDVSDFICDYASCIFDAISV